MGSHKDSVRVYSKKNGKAQSFMFRTGGVKEIIWDKAIYCQ